MRGLIHFLENWRPLLEGMILGVGEREGKEVKSLHNAPSPPLPLHCPSPPSAAVSIVVWLLTSDSPFLYVCDFIYGEVNGNPLQYSCLENPMGGEAW